MICLYAIPNGSDRDAPGAVTGVALTYEEAVERIVDELAWNCNEDGVTYDLYECDRLRHVSRLVGAIPSAVVDAARAASWET